MVCLFQQYGQSGKILDNFDALENQNLQRENYSEFFKTSHIPRTDHNRYFRSTPHFLLEKLYFLSFVKNQFSEFCKNSQKSIMTGWPLQIVIIRGYRKFSAIWEVDKKGERKNQKVLTLDRFVLVFIECFFDKLKIRVKGVSVDFEKAKKRFLFFDICM